VGVVDPLELVAELRPRWQADAACRGREGWFPAHLSRASTADAREICAGCPVRVPCASYAVGLLERGQHLSGVSAGVSLTTARVIPRKLAMLRQVEITEG
jgi:Transcription factor WhiB